MHVQITATNNPSIPDILDRIVNDTLFYHPGTHHAFASATIDGAPCGAVLKLRGFTRPGTKRRAPPRIYTGDFAIALAAMLDQLMDMSRSLYAETCYHLSLYGFDGPFHPTKR